MDDPASFRGKKRYDDFELEEGDTIPPSIVGSLIPLEDLEEDEDLAELPCSICRRWIRHDLLRAHLEGHFACQAVSEPPVSSPLVADDEMPRYCPPFPHKPQKRMRSWIFLTC